MNCPQAQDLVAGLLAEALGEADRSSLQAHLSGCPRCPDAVARLRQAWDFLGGLEPPPPPLDLGRRVQSAQALLPAPIRPPPLPRAPRSALAKPLAWAAFAVLLALLLWQGSRLLRPQPPAAPPESPPPAPPEYLAWESPAEGVLRLLGVREAALWAAPGSRGAVDPAGGELILESGTVWGHPCEREMLHLSVGDWKATVTRGRFSATRAGEAVTLTCHEGFLRVERGGGQDPLAVPEGTAVLLMGGRILGPKPARSVYPGEPMAGR